MKIVIIQKHWINLESIQKEVARLKAAREREILYTSDPSGVVDLIRGDEPALVISGQVLTTTYRGLELAREVKRANPNALFYMFSVMPEKNESVDGIIPKSSVPHGEKMIAEILASDLTKTSIEKILASA